MLRITFLSMIAAIGLVSAATAQEPIVRGLGHCDAGQCQGECKVCQPVTEKKKVSKRVYSSVCEDFCLPRCTFLGGLMGSCEECKEARCGPVHTKKYLVVKIRTHEECVTKCVPKPACEPAATSVQPVAPVPPPAMLPTKP